MMFTCQLLTCSKVASRQHMLLIVVVVVLVTNDVEVGLAVDHRARRPDVPHCHQDAEIHPRDQIGNNLYPSVCACFSSSLINYKVNEC